MIHRQDFLEMIASSVAEGLLVKNTGAVITTATELPYGAVVVSDDPDGYGSIAPFGYHRPISLKLDGTPGTINKGTYLISTTTGTVKADPGTGARTIVARALKSGVAGELLPCQLLGFPMAYAS